MTGLSSEESQAKLREYEKRIVDFFVESGEVKGVNSKFSEIFGYFITRQQLTQKQLQDLTGFSAGTISQILNQLTAVGMLRRSNIPGTHKKQYEIIEFGSKMADSISGLFEEYFKRRQRFSKGIKRDLKSIEQKIEILQKQGDTLGIKENAILEKIKRIRAFIFEFDQIIPIMEHASQRFKEEMEDLAF